MNHLVALFLLAMALQPFDLQACAVDGEQQRVHHAALHGGANPDCCNPDSGQPMKDCRDAAHCASMSPGFLVIPAAAGAPLAAAERHYDASDGQRYAGPPAPPPFRPPIA